MSEVPRKFLMSEVPRQFLMSEVPRQFLMSEVPRQFLMSEVPLWSARIVSSRSTTSLCPANGSNRLFQLP